MNARAIAPLSAVAGALLLATIACGGRDNAPFAPNYGRNKDAGTSGGGGRSGTGAKATAGKGSSGAGTGGTGSADPTPDASMKPEDASMPTDAGDSSTPPDPRVPIEFDYTPVAGLGAGADPIAIPEGCSNFDPQKVYTIGQRRSTSGHAMFEVHLAETPDQACPSIGGDVYSAAMSDSGKLVYCTQHTTLQVVTTSMATFTPDQLHFNGHVFRAGYRDGLANDNLMPHPQCPGYLRELMFVPATEQLFGLCVSTTVRLDYAGHALKTATNDYRLTLGFAGFILRTGPTVAVIDENGAATEVKSPKPLDDAPSAFIAARAIPGGFWVATNTQLIYVAYDSTWKKLASYPAADSTWYQATDTRFPQAAIDGAGRLYQRLERLVGEHEYFIVRKTPDAAAPEILEDGDAIRMRWQSSRAAQKTLHSRMVTGVVTGPSSSNPTGPLP